MYVDYTYLYLLELSIYLFSSLAFLFFKKKPQHYFEFIHKMQLENNCLKYNTKSREGKLRGKTALIIGKRILWLKEHWFQKFGLI